MYAESLPARPVGVVSTNPARCRDCCRTALAGGLIVSGMLGLAKRE
jgi:hypothetical protein